MSSQQQSPCVCQEERVGIGFNGKPGTGRQTMVIICHIYIELRWFENFAHRRFI